MAVVLLGERIDVTSFNETDYESVAQPSSAADRLNGAGGTLMEEFKRSLNFFFCTGEDEGEFEV